MLSPSPHDILGPAAVTSVALFAACCVAVRGDDTFGEAPAAGRQVSSSLPPRVTWANCRCLQTWAVPGWAPCENGCCNPDNDTLGDWCMVADRFCEGTDWGYCRPRDTTGQCRDSPRGWLDSLGFRCSEYFEGQWCNSTGGYGPGWMAGWGTFESFANRNQTASTACCLCGGGDVMVEQCLDRPGWFDARGHRCSDYARYEFCSATGGYGPGWHLEDWGPFSGRAGEDPAPQACCACGGGQRLNGTAAASGSSTSSVAAAPAASSAPPNTLSTSQAATATATATTSTSLSGSSPDATAGASPSATSTSLLPPATTSAFLAETTTQTLAERPTAAAGVLAGLRFTWNGCLCRKRWDSSMLPNFALQRSCESYCCNLDGDVIGDWCIVEDPSCEDEHLGIMWGYCRPPGFGTYGCKNDPPAWKDSQGNECDAYQYMGWCSKQGDYGKKWKAEWGYFENYAAGGRTAASACCGCGGGTPVPGQQNAHCVDKAGWQDATGDTCQIYAENAWCNSTGGYGPGWHRDWGSFERYATQFSAPAACCACGGGSAAGGMLPVSPQVAATGPAPTTQRRSTGIPSIALLALAVAAGVVMAGCCLRSRAQARKQQVAGGTGARIGNVQLGRSRKYGNINDDL